MSGECEHCGQHPVDGDCCCNTPVVVEAVLDFPCGHGPRIAALEAEVEAAKAEIVKLEEEVRRVRKQRDCIEGSLEIIAGNNKTYLDRIVELERRLGRKT